MVSHPCPVSTASRLLVTSLHFLVRLFSAPTMGRFGGGIPWMCCKADPKSYSHRGPSWGHTIHATVWPNYRQHCFSLSWGSVVSSSWKRPRSPETPLHWEWWFKVILGQSHWKHIRGTVTVTVTPRMYRGKQWEPTPYRTIRVNSGDRCLSLNDRQSSCLLGSYLLL